MTDVISTLLSSSLLAMRKGLRLLILHYFTFLLLLDHVHVIHVTTYSMRPNHGEKAKRITDHDISKLVKQHEQLSMLRLPQICPLPYYLSVRFPITFKQEHSSGILYNWGNRGTDSSINLARRRIQSKSFWLQIRSFFPIFSGAQEGSLGQRKVWQKIFS